MPTLIKDFRHAMRAPVLVLGAAAGLGPGLVEAALEMGHPVLAVCGDAEGVAALERRFDGGGRLRSVIGSVADEDSAGELAEAIGRSGAAPRLAIVNLLTCGDRGRLLEQPPQALAAKLERDVVAQLRAASMLVPLLAAGGGGRYLVINGPHAETSWLGYGQHSVAVAATRMLVQALRQETLDSPVRIQQLELTTPVRTAETAHCACPEWPDSLAVGRRALAVLNDPGNRDALVRLDPVRDPRGAPASALLMEMQP